jgi:hypothetical protein
MFGICSWECIKDMTPTSRIGGHLLADSRSRCGTTKVALTPLSGAPLNVPQGGREFLRGGARPPTQRLHG